MIWVTVSSRSCFCWLSRASPSLDYSQSDFRIDHLTMSMCRAVSCVVGKGNLLWPARFLGKILLAFACFILYSKAKLACYYRYLNFLLLHSNPHDKKDIFFFFLVLVLECVVDLHSTDQLQLLRYQWLGHRLGLLSCWMVCLGNEPRSLCCFWDCTQVLHFRLYCWLGGLLHFF